MVSSDNWLVEQLPRPMAEDPFLRQFVALIQEIATDLRQRVDDIPSFVDVQEAPEPFVRWMGQWVGLTVEPVIADADERERRLRRLVEEVGSLFVRRGTRAGLEGLLTAITGEAAHVDDTGGVFRSGQAEPNAKHAVVYLNGTGGIDEQALLRLVSAEIPVDVSFEFRVGQREIVQAEAEEFELHDLARVAIGDATDEPVSDGESMPEWAMAGDPGDPGEPGSPQAIAAAAAPEAPAPPNVNVDRPADPGADPSGERNA
jgi:phage tail-like protein